MIATEANQHEITSLSNSAQVMASRIYEKRNGLHADYLALGEVLFKLRKLLPDGAWGMRLQVLGVKLNLAGKCLRVYKSHAGNTEVSKHAVPGNQNAALTGPFRQNSPVREMANEAHVPQVSRGVVAVRGGAYFPVTKNIDGHDVWADTGVRLDLDEICSQVAEADAIMNREAGHVDGPDGVVGGPDDSHDPDGDPWDGAESDEAGEGETADGDGDEDDDAEPGPAATPQASGQASPRGQAPGVRAVGVPAKPTQLTMESLYTQVARDISQVLDADLSEEAKRTFAADVAAARAKAVAHG